ncbi:MAG: 2-oxo acid dehydrogenase subunit E2 [Acetobacterium sp.]|nr:2-oxo acid dehydrogenase subunit E2 [Acetobacterium sp.]
MMGNEIIAKENLDMATENLTNTATGELAETIKKDPVCDEEKQPEALEGATPDIKTETVAALPTEAPAEINKPVEDVAEDACEENLEEKLTAAIETLEKNLAATIKAGVKEQPSEALKGIIKDEAFEETVENTIEVDFRAVKVRATPAARRIAREFKVELRKAVGTGPNGRIEADDVKKMVVVQPGTFDYKSKEPVVIRTSLEKIAGNPSNLFSTPTELEEIPPEKPMSRKKLKDMNQKIEKGPNPELDFVPFVDENDERLKSKDADVVTKISELDFVPFVDLKAEPLREEIIVKPTPMHLLRDNEREDSGFKKRKPRSLVRKSQLHENNKTEIKEEQVSDSNDVEIAAEQEENGEVHVNKISAPELKVQQPENVLSEAGQPEVTKLEKVEPSGIVTKEIAAEAAVSAAVVVKKSDAVSAGPVETISATAKEPAQQPELAENKAKDNEEKNTAQTFRFKAARKHRKKNTVETAVISLTTEIDMTEVKDLRKKITKKIEEQAKYRCTYTDFLLLATSRALVKHPLINGRREDDRVVVHTHVNMGLTVESEHGFIVPVIQNAQTMSFVEIVKSRGDLLKAVKNKHLPQQQLEGSTFTITNLGMYGIREFTAIINQTNSAILSVGEVVQRIRIHQGEPVVRSVMKISLNLDQRVASGVDGAKFLRDIKADMENPPLLLF